mmetsp:Transcript_995/g.1830  ORF Transcript_995/g.1830 Transcript_995/m.1830 type:complete len:164 (-) Transcript_995:263-754(-)|eukprot:CAMPEP_0170196460 /NCGR_PEP_ID=MMETSP0040_2-20121228/64023_1 /TAXON_ID=641309 /ORGANISM="Lotharella oceanica, Strain CCMP622" /LENGTH=163 /DNA_ID=CAMNT_0010445877 /DNA_START=162 /DNA_END=653 /DNA_ORIENTATION=+
MIDCRFRLCKVVNQTSPKKIARDITLPPVRMCSKLWIPYASMKIPANKGTVIPPKLAPNMKHVAAIGLTPVDRSASVNAVGKDEDKANPYMHTPVARSGRDVGAAMGSIMAIMLRIELIVSVFSGVSFEDVHTAHALPRVKKPQNAVLIPNAADGLACVDSVA